MDDEASARHAAHRGSRALQRLIEHAPSSGALALWMDHADLASDDAGPAARTAPREAGGRAPLVTDGRTLHYAPAFDALPLPQQCGWLAHAVLHVALRHPARYAERQARDGDADLELWNLCADAIVNSALSHLRWLELPPGALRLERLLQAVLNEETTAEAALATWDVERLYDALDDRRPDGRRGAKTDGPRAARTRTLGRGQPADLAPGADDRPETEADADRLWAERLARAQAGDGSRALLRGALADLPQSRTPWEQVLRVQAARALSRQPGLSASRPARSVLANLPHARRGRPRLPWEPGRGHEQRVPRLVLVLDVSGSIDDALLARFATELQALARRLEAALTVVVGDERVLQVRTVDPAREDLGALARELFTGGGGTDFGPLLEEAARLRPDLVVVLTDLDGPAAVQPAAPVLWAVPPAQAMARAPFGRVLVLR